MNAVVTRLVNEPQLATHTLSQRQCCDLELLMNGGFAPLTTFLNQADYESVLNHMRLANGAFWPMPIMLDVSESFYLSLTPGQPIALRDPEGLLLAVLDYESGFAVDRDREALAVFGTVDEKHPGVFALNHHTKDFYITGRLNMVASPMHYDFTHLRFTPADLKAKFAANAWDKIVAFQTRNPMHRAHQELTRLAMEKTGANLLLHPVVGMTKPGDIDYYTRVRCYEQVITTYEPGKAILSLLPLAMRMGGPREALWHALIRKNHGCTHFIVGRDHAGPGNNSQGQAFYDPYAAQQLALKHEADLGINIVPFQEMAYSHNEKKYFSVTEFPKDETPASISGTALRELLYTGQPIPEWFSFPGVIDCLRKSHPMRKDQGFTVFLTGLPSSGKSTIANGLALKLRERTDKPVTLLDGDVIRTHLSKGLGFSREDREENITRVGFVAKEITRHRGIVICALVAPFEHPRCLVREMVGEVGGYIEVFVSTSLKTCEARDRKGLYQKARAGDIKQFTGVSDPYEIPSHPEVILDTENQTPIAAINQLMTALETLGYLT
ncbi:MAG TPA: bifunctional sulfate adenylyltransferase/adenylylsulfate kinase [Gammaproteobacteria bacterium]|nr:bifunctional sulfate adenylyltransferase/adenylylsulfate kinase [Gammaproteobacteria bacterium]